MRRREFVVAAAWPHFTGEAGALTPTAINTIQNTPTDIGAGKYYCNSSSMFGAPYLPIPASFNTDDSGNFGGGVGSGGLQNYTLFMAPGSLATSLCTSRFGAQDLLGNLQEWISDEVGPTDTVTSAPHERATPIVASVDDGNDDLVRTGYVYQFGNDLTFPDWLDPTGANPAVCAASWDCVLYYTSITNPTTIPYFLPTVGLPLYAVNGNFKVTDTVLDENGATLNTVNAIAMNTLAARSPGAATDTIMWDFYGAAATGRAMAAGGGWANANNLIWMDGNVTAGRFSLLIGHDRSAFNGYNTDGGFRCALPAPY